MKNSVQIFSSLLIVGVIFLTSILFSQPLKYKISGKIIIGGEPRWDYLAEDTSLHRLYVSHMNEVNVIDLNKDSVIGTISNLHGTHGIAFAPEFEKGFISNGRDTSVTVFNMKTLEVTNNIKVTGVGPDAIVYDPFTQRIFTFNGRSNNATAIDAKTDKVAGTVSLDGRPEFAVSDGAGKMYVNLEDKSTIEVFDPQSLTKISTWPIAPCESPSGLAIDTKNKILFSGCHNNLMAIVNASTGKLITTVPIGKGVDACRYDPQTNLAFSSNGEGTITVIKEESPTEFKVVDNIITLKGARTMELDLKNYRIYTITNIEDKDKLKSFGVLILDSN